MSTSPRNGASLFKRMIVKISQGLSRSDVQQLAYLHGVPEDKAGTALEVFSALEKEGKISENNYDLLLESLEDISRKDLLRICMAQKQGTSPRAGEKKPPVKQKRKTKGTCLGQKSLHDYYKNTNSTKCFNNIIEAEIRAYQLQLMRDQMFIKLLEIISLKKGTQGAACIVDPSVPNVLSQGWDQLPGIEAATDAILNLQTSGNRNQYTLYSTFFPSVESLKIIARAGIREVVYCEKYVPDESTPILEEYDIKCRRSSISLAC